MMENKYDNVEPKEKWEFDKNVADVFENMLERSIPQYQTMRKSVTNLAFDMIAYDRIDSHDVRKSHFEILDLGCSDGLMIQELYDKFTADYDGEGKYTGIDVSEPMLEKAKYRFLDEIISHKIKIYNCDLRTNFPDGVYDIVTSVLSLQFVPIEYRQDIVQNVYNCLSKKNGCFLMVEKVLGNTSQLNKLMVKNYYDMKSANGYSQEQIERKRLSLEGVLVPVTNDWNIQLLKQAGFRQVDVFWRWMNFVGYIAIK